jgi:hypothetical protein
LSISTVEAHTSTIFWTLYGIFRHRVTNTIATNTTLCCLLITVGAGCGRFPMVTVSVKVTVGWL